MADTRALQETTGWQSAVGWWKELWQRAIWLTEHHMAYRPRAAVQDMVQA